MGLSSRSRQQIDASLHAAEAAQQLLKQHCSHISPAREAELIKTSDFPPQRFN